MLEKLGSLQKFRYSFIALCGLSVAIMLNLLHIFDFPIIAVLCIVCILLIIFLINFLEDKKIPLVFGLFFFIGLINSSIYNQHFRVYELSTNINNERAWVKGQIIEIKEKNKYARVFIKNPEIFNDTFSALDNHYTPKMIISTHSSRIKEAHIGDTIVAKVLLKKPNSKLFQDDFDYHDYLLQNKINLIGQVRGDLYITHNEKQSPLLTRIKNYRLEAADKIAEVYDSSYIAGLSTALITGLRGQLSDQIKQEFKDSGLAHLMAISGMHMAFLAGIVFFIIRSLISLVPAIALNYNSKNIAGFITILFALFYLILAGNTLPTTRAFLMILLFVITMLFGRNKVALHTLCVIAIIILLLDPMAIFTVSFQLSFSAVFAMLMYNQIKKEELIVDFSYKAKVFRKLINVVNISIIAFTATMFTVAAHFGYISIYSIFANIFASFAMALIIMPCLFLFFIGYVVLDIEFFAHLNKYSLELLQNIAQYFSSFENSSVYVSTQYSWILLLATIIILSAIIFNHPRKYLITVLIYAVAFIVPIKYDLRPNIIEFGGNAIGLRQDNKLIILGDLEKRQIKKVLKYYKLELGSKEKLIPSCDLTGCLYDFDNKKILSINEGFDINYEEMNMVDYVLYNH